MKLALLALILLSGCSSFKLGGMVYCHHGQDCAFKSAPPQAVKP